MLASGARKGLVFGQPLRQERAAFCTRRRIKTPGAPPPPPVLMRRALEGTPAVHARRPTARLHVMHQHAARPDARQAARRAATRLPTELRQQLNKASCTAPLCCAAMALRRCATVLPCCHAALLCCCAAALPWHGAARTRGVHAARSTTRFLTVSSALSAPDLCVRNGGQLRPPMLVMATPPALTKWSVRPARDLGTRAAEVARGGGSWATARPRHARTQASCAGRQPG